MKESDLRLQGGRGRLPVGRVEIHLIYPSVHSSGERFLPEGKLGADTDSIEFNSAKLAVKFSCLNLTRLEW